MTNSYITPALFKFFRELEKNNNRDWFQKNKSRYDHTVREPLLAFVSDFAPRLKRLSPFLVADSRPNGGALFRIYRDVRFSKDKTPYKTHAGLRFPHEDGRNVHAPGYYLHLEPGSVFAGCGIWHPEAAVLRQVRDAIVADPKGWKRATSRCTLGGDSLGKPPRGYDPEHPLVSDLKRKDFVAYSRFTEKQACGEDFMRLFANACTTMKPLMAFLTRAVGARL
ncbi:MAG TPA: TIGR02453 family protein [Vicinamibacteria bacterium]|nr:TIGR02453 family protein [Vicinamibacteria bacterium]